MVNLFGWSILKANTESEPVSFTPEIKDDGALVVASGGSYGTYIDLDGTIRTESELITKYRDMAQQPEVDGAIDDIVNETIISDQSEDYIVKIDMDGLKLPDSITQKIQDEFKEILKLLNFENMSYELFKRWYIDGRIYFHVIIDGDDIKGGIKELRYIDPRKIRKVREVKQERGPNAILLKKTVDEYFVYNERGFSTKPISQGLQGNFTAETGVKITLDSIVQVTSGLMDPNNQLVLSYLHKAIRPLNLLRVLENATIIYRLSRAPERRIFYIDVGNMPRAKADQYMQDMIRKHKNKIVYDAVTGEVRDDRKYMTMIEDYWLPRREGGKGTEISTLPAGQNLGEMTDVEYFLKQLMKALNVPVSRLDPEKGFSFGRSTEITRDEVKFSKFINRLRLRFATLFLKILEKQLVLKGIMSLEDWKEIEQDIRFIYQEDNHFAELKDSEILQSRVDVVSSMMQNNLVGRYYSNAWVRKNVLQQTDEDIKELDKEIAIEQDVEQYKLPEEKAAEQQQAMQQQQMDAQNAQQQDLPEPPQLDDTVLDVKPSKFEIPATQ